MSRPWRSAPHQGEMQGARSWHLDVLRVSPAGRALPLRLTVLSGSPAGPHPPPLPPALAPPSLRRSLLSRARRRAPSARCAFRLPFGARLEAPPFLVARCSLLSPGGAAPLRLA